MGIVKFGHHPDDGDWGTVEPDYKTKVTVNFEIPLIEHLEAIWLEYTKDPERVDHRAMWAILLKAMDCVREAKKHNQ